jgi:hypothetical protein
MSRLRNAMTVAQGMVLSRGEVGERRAAGVRLFDAREAARLNQSRAFMLRLDVLARLPLTRAWFPDIDLPDDGVIAFARASLQAELTASPRTSSAAA